MADRVPNRFACLSSLYLLCDSRILPLLTAQDAARPPPSRRSLLLPTFVFSFFFLYRPLPLFLSLSFDLSLPLRIAPTLSPPLATLLCALPIALRCSFVSFFFLFFSQSPSCSIATDMSSYPSARLCRCISPCLFLSHPPSCRSSGFYMVLISLHSLFIFLRSLFHPLSDDPPRWTMSAER